MPIYLWLLLAKSQTPTIYSHSVSYILPSFKTFHPDLVQNQKKEIKPTNSPQTVNDHDGSLTRAFKAVHPLGGGRMPVDAVAVLDPLLRLRYFSPVGSFSNSPLAGRIADVLHTTVLCIGYLNNEPWNQTWIQMKAPFFFGFSWLL